MLKLFSAHNFRCFKDVELRDLRRVNIIVGKNAAGKTALLEAIRLGLAANPSALYSMNSLRGFYNFFPQAPNREQFEALWNVYFYNLEVTSPILTECEDSEGRKASLKVFYDPTKTVTPQASPNPPAPSGSLVSTIVPLAFDRTDFAGQHSVLYGTVGLQGQLNLEPGPEMGTASEFYSSLFQSNPIVAAQLFSQLSLQRREQEVIDAVKAIYGTLVSNLVVLSPGQFSAVYADLPALKEKLPLSLVSSGITKFVTILSAILARSGGVVLLDEIENGLYYDTYPLLWKTLSTLAIAYDTQIFVSSHSMECIRSVLPILRERESDFLLLRAERENGISKVTPITGDFFESALEQNFEVR